MGPPTIEVEGHEVPPDPEPPDTRGQNSPVQIRSPFPITQDVEDLTVKPRELDPFW